ncbi:MAG: hypothetical protein QOF35_955, partial [Actinomycetota bacterium]|nr:hypothetical protein [Actinomycetota bacterium]
MHTINIPFRRICSALPAVALVGGSIVMSAPAAPIAGHLGLVSSHTPTVVVPDVAMTTPASQSPVVDNLHPASEALANAVAPNAVVSNVVAASGVATSHATGPKAPVSILQPGTAPDSRSPVTLDAMGIPARALDGYRQAASVTASADPSCHIDWALLAGIGRVESNHARFGGNHLDSAGVAQPGIIGIALNGSNGTALIRDTDNGALDRDTTFDRAVGPMQFIPSTWRFAGVDANGDGVKDPHNLADAAAATAVYLCSGSGDLRIPADLQSAILRYNHSSSYVRLVSSIANAYRHGVRALPASDLAPASSAGQAPVISGPSAQNGRPTARKPVVRRASSVQAKAPGRQAAVARLVARPVARKPSALPVPVRALAPPVVRKTQPVAA